MDNNKTRSLSPLEAQVVLRLEWDRAFSISRPEVITALGSAARADRVIRSLLRKRWLERTQHGKYLLISATRGPEGIPDSNILTIGANLVAPYYYAYATAAAHYRFSSQSRSTVWVATKRPHAEVHLREALFRFVALTEHKFFGFRPTDVFAQKVMMSDPEKTLLDCLDKVQFAGGIGEATRIITQAAPQVDWERMVDYTRRLDSLAVVQRLGFLAAKAKAVIPDPACRTLHSMLKRDSRSFLAPKTIWGTQGKYDAQWQVIVNVPDSEIYSEV